MVYKKMKEFGNRLHFSVFRCDLTRQGRAELIAQLTEIINHDEDRIMIVDLGPVHGDVEERLFFMGSSTEEEPSRQFIV